MPVHSIGVCMWVCARLCLCADVRSEEEVAVFV